MAKAKGLTYEELIEYGENYYNRGGDSVVECWDRRTYDEYVSMFGPITKREALAMFRTSYEVDREHAAMAAW